MTGAPLSPIAKARLDTLAAQPLTEAAGTSGFEGSRRAVRDLLAYRELLGLLVRRELKMKYKDSALGFLWTLIRPLVTLVVYYVAIGHFLGAAKAIPGFAIYVFTGLITYQLFSDTVSGGAGSILTNAGLVKKVYLPREVFPISVAGSALVNFAMQLVVLLGASVVFGDFPTGPRWWYFPLSVAVTVAWGLALGMVLAAVTVYLRDVQYLVEIALMVLFWASPIVYSWQLVVNAAPERLAQVYLANPITVSVLGMQQVFWTAGSDQSVPPDLAARLGIMLAIGLVALVLAQQVFARLQTNFAQEL